MSDVSRSKRVVLSGRLNIAGNGLRLGEVGAFEIRQLGLCTKA